MDIKIEMHVSPKTKFCRRRSNLVAQQLMPAKFLTCVNSAKTKRIFGLVNPVYAMPLLAPITFAATPPSDRPLFGQGTVKALPLPKKSQKNSFKVPVVCTRQIGGLLGGVATKHKCLVRACKGGTHVQGLPCPRLQNFVLLTLLQKDTSHAPKVQVRALSKEKEFCNRNLFDIEISHNLIELSYANRFKPLHGQQSSALLTASCLDKGSFIKQKVSAKGKLCGFVPKPHNGAKLASLVPFCNKVKLLAKSASCPACTKSASARVPKQKLVYLQEQAQACLKELAPQIFPKKASPLFKVWGFAFASTFFLLSISALVKKQGQGQEVVPFFRRKLPGLNQIYHENSWESFENITNQYLNRDTSLQLDSFTKLRFEYLATFSSPWEKQLRKHFVGIFGQGLQDEARGVVHPLLRTCNKQQSRASFARAFLHESKASSLARPLTLPAINKGTEFGLPTLTNTSLEKVPFENWLVSPWYQIKAFLPPCRSLNKGTVHGLKATTVVKRSSAKLRFAGSRYKSKNEENSYKPSRAQLRSSPFFTCPIYKTRVRQYQIERPCVINASNLRKLFNKSKTGAQAFTSKCRKHKVLTNRHERSKLGSVVLDTPSPQVHPCKNLSRASSYVSKQHVQIDAQAKAWKKIEKQNDSIPSKLACFGENLQKLESIRNEKVRQEKQGHAGTSEALLGSTSTVKTDATSKQKDSRQHDKFFIKKQTESENLPSQKNSATDKRNKKNQDTSFKVIKKPIFGPHNLLKNAFYNYGVLSPPPEFFIGPKEEEIQIKQESEKEEEKETDNSSYSSFVPYVQALSLALKKEATFTDCIGQNKGLELPRHKGELREISNRDRHTELKSQPVHVQKQETKLGKAGGVGNVGTAQQRVQKASSLTDPLVNQTEQNKNLWPAGAIGEATPLFARLRKQFVLQLSRNLYLQNDLPTRFGSPGKTSLDRACKALNAKSASQGRWGRSPHRQNFVLHNSLKQTLVSTPEPGQGKRAEQSLASARSSRFNEPSKASLVTSCVPSLNGVATKVKGQEGARHGLVPCTNDVFAQSKVRTKQSFIPLYVPVLNNKEPKQIKLSTFLCKNIFCEQDKHNFDNLSRSRPAYAMPLLAPFTEGAKVRSKASHVPDGRGKRPQPHLRSALQHKHLPFTIILPKPNQLSSLLRTFSLPSPENDSDREALYLSGKDKACSWGSVPTGAEGASNLTLHLSELSKASLRASCPFAPFGGMAWHGPPFVLPKLRLFDALDQSNLGRIFSVQGKALSAPSLLETDYELLKLSPRFMSGYIFPELNKNTCKTFSRRSKIYRFFTSFAKLDARAGQRGQNIDRGTAKGTLCTFVPKPYSPRVPSALSSIERSLLRMHQRCKCLDRAFTGRFDMLLDPISIKIPNSLPPCANIKTSALRSLPLSWRLRDNRATNNVDFLSQKSHANFLTNFSDRETKKKMQYRQLELNEKKEVKRLFKKFCSFANTAHSEKNSTHAQNYVLPFKRSHITSYKNYLNWPKDSLAAIRISPSLEEDKIIAEEGIEIQAKRDKEAHAEKEKADLSKNKNTKQESSKKSEKDGKKKSGASEAKLRSNSEALLGSQEKQSFSLASGEDSEEEKAEQQKSEEDESVKKQEEVTRFDYLNVINEKEKRLEKAKKLRRSAFLNKKAFSRFVMQNAQEKGTNRWQGMQNTVLPTRGTKPDGQEGAGKGIWYKPCTGERSEASLFVDGSYMLQNDDNGKAAQTKQNFLVVSDRKASFFGRTNLFPKRLVAQDQKQINDQVIGTRGFTEGESFASLRPEQNGVFQPGTSEAKLGSVPTSSGNQVKLLALGGEATEVHAEQAVNCGGSVASPTTSLAPAGMPHFEVTNEQNKSLAPELVPKQSLLKKNRDKELASMEFSLKVSPRNKTFFNFVQGKGTGQRGQSREGPSMIAQPERTKQSFVHALHRPIYTPNFRLRIKQSEVLSRIGSGLCKTKNTNETTFFKRAHRWWQKRRIYSSLLGSPSKRYMAMPNITTNDWKKIVEWQLKTYLFEEEKRLNRLVIKKPQHHFKIKKLWLYLPWVTLKKPVKRGKHSNCKTAVPCTKTGRHVQGLSLKQALSLPSRPCPLCTPSSQPKQRLERFVQAPVFVTKAVKAPSLSGEQRKRSTRQSLVDNLFVRDKLNDISQMTPKRLLFEWPVTRLDYKNNKKDQFFDTTLAEGTCKTKKTLYNARAASFVPNWKFDYYLISPYSQSLYSNRLSVKGERGKKGHGARQESKARLLQNAVLQVKRLTSRNNLALTEQNGIQNGAYQPFLFEAVTTYSYLLINQLFLAFVLQRFFLYIYRLVIKNFVNTLKLSDSVLGNISALFQGFQKSTRVAKSYRVKKQFKDVSGSLDTLSASSEIVWYLRNSCRGRTNIRGVILVGAANSETTDLLKAIGGEAHVPVIVQSLRALTLTQSNPKQRLEKILIFAQKKAPCLLFLDDIDAIGKARPGLLQGINKTTNYTTLTKQSLERTISDSQLTHNLLVANLLATSENFRFKENVQGFASYGRFSGPFGAKASSASKTGLCKTMVHGATNTKRGFVSHQNEYFRDYDTDKNKLLSQNGKGSALGEPELEKGVTNTKPSFAKSFAQHRKVDLMLRLLTVMDGISHLRGVVLITISQNPSQLDPALLRPGRFERLIHVKLPNKKRRRQLLQMQTKRIGHTNPMPWDYLSEQTVNMSGAEIASAVNYSAFRAVFDSTVHTISTLEHGINFVKGKPFSANVISNFSKTERHYGLANQATPFLGQNYSRAKQALRILPSSFTKGTKIKKLAQARQKSKPGRACKVLPTRGCTQRLSNLFSEKTNFKQLYGINNTERSKASLVQIAFYQAGKGVVQNVLLHHPKAFCLPLPSSSENIWGHFSGSTPMGTYKALPCREKQYRKAQSGLLADRGKASFARALPEEPQAHQARSKQRGTAKGTLFGRRRNSPCTARTRSHFSVRLIGLFAGQASEAIYLNSSFCRAFDGLRDNKFRKSAYMTVFQSNLGYLEKLRATLCVKKHQNVTCTSKGRSCNTGFCLYGQGLSLKQALHAVPCPFGARGGKKVQVPCPAHACSEAKLRSPDCVVATPPHHSFQAHNFVRGTFFSTGMGKAWLRDQCLGLVDFHSRSEGSKHKFIKSNFVPNNEQIKEEEVCEIFNSLKQDSGKWYRLYLNHIEQNKNNKEWLAPDQLSNQRISLPNYQAKSLSVLPCTNKMSKDYQSFPTDLGLLNIDNFYYNIVLTGFYTAFTSCLENRELLDLLADHLIRFKILRLHEMNRISSFYLRRTTS